MVLNKTTMFTASQDFRRVRDVWLVDPVFDATRYRPSRYREHSKQVFLTGNRIQSVAETFRVLRSTLLATPGTEGRDTVRVSL